MKCPACGNDRNGVIESRCFDGKAVDRRRLCGCGAKWSTREIYIRGTLTGPTLPTTKCVLPAEQIRATDETNLDQTAVGSPCIPSGSDPDLQAFKASESDPTRVERKPRRRKTDESPEFQAWYEAYPRKVGRGSAWRAWCAVKNMPTLESLLATLKWQLVEWDAKAKAWGYEPPHPASYLRATRWTDQPVKASAAPKPTGPKYCDWHASYKNNRKPSSYPKDWCPECQHCTAASRPRGSSEPTAIGDFLDIGGPT